MSRYDYYEELKESARRIREKYSISGYRVLPSEIKSILFSEGVGHVEYFTRHNFKRISGAYESTSAVGPVVYINKDLPQDPKAFTYAHELKHHLHDRELSIIQCGESNVDDEIEIGANIFAAELIFPEQLFSGELLKYCETKTSFRAEHLVHLKNGTGTTLSYAALTKRVERCGFASQSSLRTIKWSHLEEELYPNPFRRGPRRAS